MSQQVLKRGVNDSVNHGRSAEKLMAVEAFACRPSRPVNYFRAPSTGKLSTEFARGQVASQLANCFPIPWRNVCRRWEPRDNDLVGEGEGVRKLRGTEIIDAHRGSARSFRRFACFVAWRLNAVWELKHRGGNGDRRIVIAKRRNTRYFQTEFQSVGRKFAKLSIIERIC